MQSCNITVDVQLQGGAGIIFNRFTNNIYYAAAGYALIPHFILPAS